MTGKKSGEDPKKESSKSIGVDVKTPKDTCSGDKNCPFHGYISVRGRQFQGIVIKAKNPKNAIVEWSWKRKVPKYERYEKRRTRVMAHNPACINAKVGETVKIMETKKISKSKCFVVIEKL